MSADDLNLEELAALEAAATAGPWRASGEFVNAALVIPDPDGYDDTALMLKEDAALIVALRNAAPALIAAARAGKFEHESALSMASLVRETQAERDEALAAVERVRVLHGASLVAGTALCTAGCEGRYTLWPCATVRALDGEEAATR